MATFEIGQVVDVDVLGLRVVGLRSGEDAIPGTVVALGPGVVTVRLELGPAGQEVTVSPGRIHR